MIVSLYVVRSLFALITLVISTSLLAYHCFHSVLAVTGKFSAIIGLLYVCGSCERRCEPDTASLA